MSTKKARLQRLLLWLRLRWLLFWALLGLGCAGAPVRPSAVAAPDDFAVVAAALAQWDEVIGCRLSVNAIQIDRYSLRGVPAGQLRGCAQGLSEITIYPEAHGLNAEEVALVLWHELGHLHLSCSDDDHMPDTIMAHKVQRSMLVAPNLGFSAAQLARIRSHCQ